jgi:hypothetical protein
MAFRYTITLNTFQVIIGTLVSVGIGGNVGVGCWQNVGVGRWWKNQGIFRVLQIFFMVSCLNLWKFIVFDSVPFGYGLCGTESIWTLSEWQKVHN